jgi:hypothetical protein
MKTVRIPAEPLRDYEAPPDDLLPSPVHKEFLQAFINSDLKDVFRLTGGTALIAFYLEPRLSHFFLFNRSSCSTL